jgi:hypothetical protein
MRVQLVRNMGVVEGNTPVAPNTWEEVKKEGDAAIEKWIDDNMKNKSCLIVLIGTDTHKRPWVKYEIKKAWKDGKGILGIHINNLKCPNSGTCVQGKNPFDSIEFTSNGKKIVPAVYVPKASGAYTDISENLSDWVDKAIKQRN